MRVNKRAIDGLERTSEIVRLGLMRNRERQSRANGPQRYGSARAKGWERAIKLTSDRRRTVGIEQVIDAQGLSHEGTTITNEYERTSERVNELMSGNERQTNESKQMSDRRTGANERDCPIRTHAKQGTTIASEWTTTLRIGTRERVGTSNQANE